jgi:hypothetical protein
MLIPVGWANFIMPYTFTGDAEEMINTIGVDVSGWGGDYVDGADWLAEQWFTCFQGGMSDDVTLGPPRIVVGQDGGDPLTFSGTATVVGSDTDFPLWPNSATLIRKISALGGRRNRGRMYVPGMAIRAQISQAGVIDAGFLADLQTNLNTFLEVVNTGATFNPTDLGVLHSEAPAAPAVIVDLVADPKLATQRRRLRP